GGVRGWVEPDGLAGAAVGRFRGCGRGGGGGVGGGGDLLLAVASAGGGGGRALDADAVEGALGGFGEQDVLEVVLEALGHFQLLFQLHRALLEIVVEDEMREVVLQALLAGTERDPFPVPLSTFDVLAFGRGRQV
ncbi:hypothetical protein LTR48_009207, partial [Friedmanniomyces endolithicus]